MRVEIAEEPSSSLEEYAHVQIAFEVTQRFAVCVSDSGLGGLQLVLESVEVPRARHTRSPSWRVPSPLDMLSPCQGPRRSGSW